MKHLKKLGLLAVATAALMACAGTASATITSPAGTKYNGPIQLTSSNFAYEGSVVVACAHSTMEGTVNGGDTTIALSSVSFSECGKDTWVAVDEGTLAVSGNGVVTSTDLALTTQLHRVILGFPITAHCIFRTNNSNVGTLTEGAGARVHFNFIPIPMEETDGSCGDPAFWGASYSVTIPGYLAVD